jgi:NADPH:quinone reductase-like Zn-dependent oxidoreductase
VIGFGTVATNNSTAGFLRTLGALYIKARLVGRKGTFYGITALYRKNRQPFMEDLPKLFELLAARKIAPKIAHRLGLLDARRGNELQEAGGVDGKIVLVA